MLRDNDVQQLPGPASTIWVENSRKLANAKPYECRRRVQNETLGHRRHEADLYRGQRSSTKASELEERCRQNPIGLRS